MANLFAETPREYFLLVASAQGCQSLLYKPKVISELFQLCHHFIRFFLNQEFTIWELGRGIPSNSLDFACVLQLLPGGLELLVGVSIIGGLALGVLVFGDSSTGAATSPVLSGQLFVLAAG
jgi:hypothetical protein